MVDCQDMSNPEAREQAIFLYEDVIRGHHVYKAIWSPLCREFLQVAKEPSHPMDRYAVGVMKGETVVGHVPRSIAKTLWYFLGHDGAISYEVTGRRKHGKGLEVPCVYKLVGEEKMVMKAKEILVKRWQR